LNQATGLFLTKQNAARLNQAIKFMHSSAPVRILAPEQLAALPADASGLDKPRFTVQLFSADGLYMVIHFGNRANGGILYYMRITGRGETYLMSGFVGEAWLKLKEHSESVGGQNLSKMRHHLGGE